MSWRTSRLPPCRSAYAASSAGVEDDVEAAVLRPRGDRRSPRSSRGRCARCASRHPRRRACTGRCRSGSRRTPRCPPRPPRAAGSTPSSRGAAGSPTRAALSVTVKVVVVDDLEARQLVDVLLVAEALDRSRRSSWRAARCRGRRRSSTPSTNDSAVTGSPLVKVRPSLDLDRVGLRVLGLDRLGDVVVHGALGVVVDEAREDVVDDRVRRRPRWCWSGSAGSGARCC